MSMRLWRPPAGWKRHPNRPANAFGERDRLALVLTDHLKRTRYVNEQDRVLEDQIRLKYMGGWR